MPQHTWGDIARQALETSGEKVSWGVTMILGLIPAWHLTMHDISDTLAIVSLSFAIVLGYYNVKLTKMKIKELEKGGKGDPPYS